MNRVTTEQPTAVCLAQRIFSLFLASWIFVLSLAGVSPALHDWTHGSSGHASSTCHTEHSNNDTQNSAHDAHICAVTLLHSSVQIWIPEALLPNPQIAKYDYSIHPESNPIIQSRGTHRSRAPPIEQIV